MERDSSTRTRNRSDSQPPSSPSHARIPRNRQAVHTYIPHATMECERWLRARLHDLRMKTIFDQKTDIHLPQKLEKSFTEFNPDERNIRGETLIISVIRYEPDKANQVGLISHHNANLTAADKMGNTALMYAAMYSQSSLVSYLAEELSKRWALDAFRAKNRMGYTAETLARKNERYMMLKKQRLKTVKRLRDFVASNLKYSPEFASWKRFVCLYRVSASILYLCAIMLTLAEKDSLQSGSSLPQLESVQRRNSLSPNEGTSDLHKTRSMSEVDLRANNLPKLPDVKLTSTRRLTKRTITSKITHGLSFVCPHISISSC
uniref:ANK_REP_REGION domain-containing protein n=1 Tax=Parascaris equorum TaxID=6256 RepID=A0A914RY01_PAREQ